MKAKEREEILIKGLAEIASNLGEGGFTASERYQARTPLRRKASETLRNAGYHYQENPDGWVQNK